MDGAAGFFFCRSRARGTDRKRLQAAPDAREVPKTTKEDIIACIPVAFCSAAAHSFSVFALSGICIQDCVCVCARGLLRCRAALLRVRALPHVYGR